MLTSNSNAGKASRQFATPLVVVLAAWLGGCGQEAKTEPPQARPVRTVTIEKREAGVPITLTGRIEAEDEVAFSFRISGRLLQSDLKIGDRLQPGQLVARLELQNELNALRSAQANLAAAQGQLTSGEQSFRSPRHTPQTGLDHARKSRSSKTGAANRTGAGRCRRSPAQVGP